MKNKLIFATVLVSILLLLSSFCFAEDQTPIEPRTSDVEQINVTDEAVTTNLENEAVTTDIESTETPTEVVEEQIHEGDLYIFEDTVNMDKLVDGNVYIIGKDVTITGQIAGNLFVIADNLTIGDNTSASTYNGYVFYNIYALANKATLYSSCYDLYIAGNDITIENSFYLYRDLKMGATNANVFATIGRNVDTDVKNLNLKKDDNTSATIYGNINYSSSNEIDSEILNISVRGEKNYSKSKSNSNLLSLMKSTLFISFLFSLVILVLVIALIFRLILFIIRKSKKDNTIVKENIKEIEKDEEK